MKLNSDSVIALIIIFIALYICHKYNNIHEGFTDGNNTNNSPANVNAVDPEPDSQYNLQQYIESNPPTGSKVIRREVSHSLPDIMDSDITMAGEKQIRFGSMRGEVDSPNDSFYLEGVTHASQPHLKMVLGDKERKNASFQIYGAACDTHGNCGLDGRKLYQFDSQPNFTINNRTGNTIHSFSKDGHYTASGDLRGRDVLAGRDVKAERNTVVGRNLTTTGNATVGGDLVIDGTVTANGRRIDEPQDVDVNVAGNHKADRYYAPNPPGVTAGSVTNPKHANPNPANPTAKGTANVYDANVRGRLYFSQAGEGDNPRDITHNHSDQATRDKWGTVHAGDPMYLEKIRTDEHFEEVNIRVGCSHHNVKKIRVDNNIVAIDASTEFRNNPESTNCHGTSLGITSRIQGTPWGDRFRAFISKHNGQKYAIVQRLDSHGGWGQDLVLKGYKKVSSSHDHKHALRIVIQDDKSDAFEVWGNSCQSRTNANCSGPGERLMRLDGKGNLWIKGRIQENVDTSQ